MQASYTQKRNGCQSDNKCFVTHLLLLQQNIIHTVKVSIVPATIFLLKNVFRAFGNGNINHITILKVYPHIKGVPGTCTDRAPSGAAKNVSANILYELVHTCPCPIRSRPGHGSNVCG